MKKSDQIYEKEMLEEKELNIPLNKKAIQKTAPKTILPLRFENKIDGRKEMKYLLKWKKKNDGKRLHTIEEIRNIYPQTLITLLFKKVEKLEQGLEMASEGICLNQKK